MFHCSQRQSVSPFILLVVALFVISYMHISTPTSSSTCVNNSTLEKLKDSHDRALAKATADLENSVHVTGPCVVAWSLYVSTVVMLCVTYLCLHHRGHLYAKLCCITCSDSTMAPVPSTSKNGPPSKASTLNPATISPGHHTGPSHHLIWAFSYRQ